MHKQRWASEKIVFRIVALFWVQHVTALSCEFLLSTHSLGNDCRTPLHEFVSRTLDLRLRTLAYNSLI